MDTEFEKYNVLSTCYSLVGRHCPWICLDRMWRNTNIGIVNESVFFIGKYHSVIWCTLERVGAVILYIKMNVCLFVCLFVPYTNPHFWTDRNQTSHTSTPWCGRDRRVCMGPQYFTFPTFSTYFVGSGCRFVRSRWLPAPHYSATALYPWCGVCWCDVTHGGFCNENAEKWTECVCVKMETW